MVLSYLIVSDDKSSYNFKKNHRGIIIIILFFEKILLLRMELPFALSEAIVQSESDIMKNELIWNLCSETGLFFCTISVLNWLSTWSNLLVSDKKTLTNTWWYL